MLKKHNCLVLLCFGILITAVANAAQIGLWHLDGSGEEDMTADSTFDTWGGNGQFILHYDSTSDKIGSGCWYSCHDQSEGSARIGFSQSNDITNYSAFAISFWVKPINSGQYSTLVSFGNNNLYFKRMDNNPNGANRYSLTNSGLGDWGNWWELGLSMTDGHWYNIIITADGQQASLYLNNQLLKTITQTGSLNSSPYLYLGCKAFGSDLHNMMFDELVIIDNAADTNWINTVYNKGLAKENLIGARQNCIDITQKGLRLPGDLNSDCDVNMADIAILAYSYWLQCNEPGGCF